MQAFPPQPGMATHMGMPPGQHVGMNPHGNGPPMGHMQGQGMPPQMQPGMPGPHHVSQGGPMMAGMPHGMNPGANAMAHLQAGPQMFPTNQHQQMQHMHQQNLMAQQAQQEHLARNKALLNQQRQHNPMMAAGLQGPGQGMTPQMQQQLQQQNQLRMNIPNMQQNPMTAQMMQQMQQHQQQQQQAGGPNGPPQRQAGPPGGPGAQMRGPPQMGGMHPPQAGQNAQGGPQGPAQMRPQPSNQGMQMAQPQTPGQAQQAQQPPQRPQMPGRQPSNQGSPPQNVQQSQQTPLSQPQQEPTVSSAGPQPSIAGAQEGQNRGPQQQGQQQAPQQNQQPNNEMTKQMMQAPIQNQYQRNAAFKQAASMQQMTEMLSQTPKIKLVLFAEALSGIISDRDNLPPFEQLQLMTAEYFSDAGHFRWKNTPSGDFTIPMSTMARWFMAQYTSGVQNVQLSVSRAQPTDGAGVQGILCEQATFTFTFGKGQFIQAKGKLRATLSPDQKFEQFEFESIGHEEYIASDRLRQMFQDGSPNLTKSPTMNKSKPPGKKGKAAQGKTISLNESDIPTYPTHESGFTFAVFRFMETANTFTAMQNIFDFSHQNKIVSGQIALQKYMEAQKAGQLPMQQQQMAQGFTNPQAAAAAAAAAQGNPQINLPPAVGPNGFPQGGNFGAMRQQPGMNSQFTSPAANHLGLPNATNSPHMRQGGSPGQQQMPPHMQGTPMAQQMVAQHSMQGTNSSAPSSNASPNAATKKRRASQAKVEGPGDPGGMGQVNGAMPNPKVTPKMGNQQKRPRPS